MIQKITLIGSGNVAHNLGHAFLLHGLEVVEVYSRTKDNAAALAKKIKAKYTDDLTSLNHESDLYIIASSDDSIEEIADHLSLKHKLVVHTSGSVGISSLKKASRSIGSFYPLQTFTKNHQADFSEIPICIEGGKKEDEEKLIELAKKLTNKVIHLSSEQRKKLHLSAVFASNFSNYMQVIAQDLCEEQKIDFELLQPLIREVFEKNLTQNAIENQTGPARRGDKFTMNKHLELLKENKELSSLYTQLSKLIMEKYRQK